MAQRQIEQGQTAVQAKHAQAETAANQQDAARPAGHPFLRLQQAVGNRLAGAVLQAKLKIGRPNDRFEQEADHVADRIMGPSWSPAMLGTNITQPAGQPRIQRVCSQCRQEFERPEGPQVENLCPSCRANLMQRQPLDEEEEPDELLQRQMMDENEEPEEVLQTKASPGQATATPTHVASAINGLKGGGRPLPDTTRTFFESRFGRDLGQVRVHTNRQAEQTARAVNARAFTVGQDVVFNTGEYAPETKTGQRLLAHELTHVVQQAAAGPRLQRQANNEAPAAESPQEEAAVPALIVDDEMVTALAPGQMRKGEFLSQLNTAVCATAESALAGTGQSTDGCPYLRFWFDYYRQKSSQHIERAIRRYAPEARQATTAQEYIPFITERVRQGVERWAQTGEVTGVPEDLPADVTAASSGEGGSQTGNVQFKAKSGGARSPANPRVVQAQLGDGRFLDGGIRSRMESAFGTGFGHVRIHTDAQAASLSNKHNARAFTIGQHVAFGAGEYRPGTLVGDAILAHELAHTQQQQGANNILQPIQMEGNYYNKLEDDADNAVLAVMPSLWENMQNKANDIKLNALPRLKSGLKLQRCETKSSGPIGDKRLTEARRNFQNNNDHLAKAELAKIDSSLSSTIDKNLDIWIAFYDYYSNHDIEKASSKQMRKWSTDQLAETSPRNDTLLHPKVLASSYPVKRLGPLLIHEFTHTRHMSNPMGLGDFQEGDSYAIEYFFAVRSGDTTRQNQILNIMRNPTKIVIANLVPDLKLAFRKSYATLVGLYEIIDKGISSHGTSPFATPSPLTKDEARALSAELVSRQPDEHSARLKRITKWVSSNYAQFNPPI